MMKFYIKCFIYLFVIAGSFSANAGVYEDYFKALKLDDERSVATLLARGFDPNSRDESGQVGLFVALREGSLKAAAQLLQHPDIRVDERNDAGESTLMMAALRGHRNWAARLLERGATLHHEGWTPLHYAATGPDSASVVSLLLARGAPVDARSPNGSTPLMMAARYGSEESVQWLLAKGADARLRNQRELTAADFARLAGRESLAVRLQAAAR